MPPLNLFLLDPPRLEAEGVELCLGRHTALALLACLAAKSAKQDPSLLLGMTAVG